MSGVAEAWLLKATGDFHWQLLAAELQQPTTRWQDQHGNALYASFIAIRYSGELLAHAEQGDRVVATSTLEAAGANRYFSVHELRVSGRSISGRIEMLSSFVRRDGGTNRALVRAAPTHQRATSDSVTNPCQALLSQRRLAREEARESFGRESATSHDHLVCAAEDYNALGLLYFASFPRIVDRAERDARSMGIEHPKRCYLGPPLERSIHYYGNADAGDTLRTWVRNDGNRSTAYVFAGTELMCASLTARDGLHLRTVSTCLQ